MTNILKYDVVIVKFPFASSLKYKARPAVVVSSDLYNDSSRNTLLIMAISSSKDNRLNFELVLKDWKGAGLLKSSIFKSAIATIEKSSILTKIGSLFHLDRESIENMIAKIC